MYSIKLNFRPFNKITHEEILGSYGVYILWDSTAKVKPTYIGEGYLIDRLSEHYKDRRSFKGLIAITKDKKDAEIAEAIILLVAEQINRSPSQNIKAGKLFSHVNNIFREHGKLKITISGRHPFKKPGAVGSLLQDKAEISLYNIGDEVLIGHQFRKIRNR